MNIKFISKKVVDHGQWMKILHVFFFFFIEQNGSPVPLRIVFKTITFYTDVCYVITEVQGCH